jgi:hypothetical protein
VPGHNPVEIPVVTATNVADGHSVETIVLTLSNVDTPGPGSAVQLFGVVNLTVGTNGVGAVVRVRRGGLTGSLIGTAQTDTVIATDKYTIPFEVVDGPVDEAGASYVVTVTETSGTVNGTVNYASIGGIAF